MSTKYVLKKSSGYEISTVSHTLVYNKNGEYVGQWQPSAYDEGEIFIGASDFDGVNVAPLTEDQMKGADEEWSALFCGGRAA